MAVARARLQQETADNKAFIKVIIDKVTGTGGREVVYRYDWTLNGQPAGDSSDRMTGFKRGDRVAVKITPVIDRTYPLSETAAALRHVGTAGARGTVVITMAQAPAPATTPTGTVGAAAPLATGGAA